MARRKTRNYFEPQRHPDHPRPVTRRQMIQQGFMSGAATVATGSVMSMFANPRAMAASHSRLSQELQDIINAGTCPLIKTGVNNPLPFIRRAQAHFSEKSEQAGDMPAGLAAE